MPRHTRASPLRIRTHRPPLRIVVFEGQWTQRDNAQNPRRWFPGMACSICGEYIRLWQPFNFDHHVPLAKGGAKGRKNKRFTHVLCNTIKGDRHPFSLRTPAEREAIRPFVRPEVYAKLLRVWAGEL